MQLVQFCCAEITSPGIASTVVNDAYIECLLGGIYAYSVVLSYQSFSEGSGIQRALTAECPDTATDLNQVAWTPLPWAGSGSSTSVRNPISDSTKFFLDGAAVAANVHVSVELTGPPNEELVFTLLETGTGEVGVAYCKLNSVGTGSINFTTEVPGAEWYQLAGRSATGAPTGPVYAVNGGCLPGDPIHSVIIWDAKNGAEAWFSVKISDSSNVDFYTSDYGNVSLEDMGVVTFSGIAKVPAGGRIRVFATHDCWDLIDSGVVTPGLTILPASHLEAHWIGPDVPRTPCDGGPSS